MSDASQSARGVVAGSQGILVDPDDRGKNVFGIKSEITGIWGCGKAKKADAVFERYQFLLLMLDCFGKFSYYIIGGLFVWLLKFVINAIVGNQENVLVRRKIEKMVCDLGVKSVLKNMRKSAMRRIKSVLNLKRGHTITIIKKNVIHIIKIIKSVLVMEKSIIVEIEIGFEYGPEMKPRNLNAKRFMLMGIDVDFVVIRLLNIYKLIMLMGTPKKHLLGKELQVLTCTENLGD